MAGTRDLVPPLPPPLPRIAIVLLIALLAVGILMLVGYARALSEKVETLRDAQSDNLTWLVSQLEVDFLNFTLALERHDPDTPRSNEALQHAFDIWYSRVITIRSGAAGFDPQRDADLIGRFSTITDAKRRLAEQVDALVQGQHADAALHAMVAALTPEVRQFVVGALRVFIDRATSERKQHQAVLGRYALLSIFLVVLLSGIIGLTAHLYRTLRDRAEVTARISSNLQKTIEASLDAVIVADAKGQVRQYNSSAESIFGYSSAETVGRNIAELLIPERFRALHDRAIRNFHRTDIGSLTDRGRVLLTAVARNGREFPVEATIVSDRDTEGQTIFIGFLRDISDQLATENSLRLARDEAERSAQAKARFLAVMSHEMRTPLHGVIAALDLIEATALPEEQRNLLEIARSCGRSALEQVDDVLELTRLEGTVTPEVPQPFDPAAMIAEIASQNRSLAKRRGTILRVEAGPGLIVSGPRRAFARVLTNLIGNAVKFTTGGEIVLRLSHSPDGEDAILLRVEVADTGIGIASEQQARIFDDFETLDSSYARPVAGTGLGLGIARRTVVKMGGKIGVESVPGEGSLFWFTARCAPARTPAPPRTEAGAADDTRDASTGLSLLVVEDNPVNRTLITRMLHRLGHQVETAADGASAVTLTAARGYDLILMDISMPEMDGIETTRRIRAGGGPSATVPVLALTSHALPEDVARFRAAGMDEVLVKPVTIASLGRLLAPFVQRATAVPAPPAPPRRPALPLIADEMLAEVRSMLGDTETARIADEVFEAVRVALQRAGAVPAADPPAARASAVHDAAGAAAMIGALGLHRALCDLDDELRNAEGDALLPSLIGNAGRLLEDTLNEMRNRLPATA